LIRRRTSTEVKRKRDSLERRRLEEKVNSELQRKRRKDLFVLRAPTQISRSQYIEELISPRQLQKRPPSTSPKGFDFQKMNPADAEAMIANSKLMLPAAGVASPQTAAVEKGAKSPRSKEPKSA
jgi:hypothetical protein